MRLNKIKKIPKLQVHYADDKRLIASKGMKLVQSLDQGSRWEKLCGFSNNFIKLSLSEWPLYRRLIRGGVHIVSPIQFGNLFGWLVVIEKTLFYVSITGDQVNPLFRIERGKRPLRRGICLFNNTIILGEYWGNTDRVPVNINIVDFDNKHEVLYQFAENTVRHIHAVEIDPYSETLWISTGDYDSECMVAILEPKTGIFLKKIGHGTQQWRTISFVFKSDAVYWGTDNNLGENRIYRFDRTTCLTQVVGEVIGPVYYNTCLENYIVFGTTIEKGEGEQDGYGRLYAVNDNGLIQEVWRLKKDCWNARLFGYGVFEFAEGQLQNNRFWVTAKGFENGMQSILFELKSK